MPNKQLQQVYTATDEIPNSRAQLDSRPTPAKRRPITGPALPLPRTQLRADWSAPRAADT